MSAAVLERETVEVHRETAVRHTLTVLDRPDACRSYRSGDLGELAAAMALFDDLVGRDGEGGGYLAYVEEAGGGGTIVRRFVADEDLTFVPRLVGG